MNLLILWLCMRLSVCVMAQTGNPLLSVVISDVVSIFTSVTSYVGSQVSVATQSTDSDSSSATTNTPSSTTSSTTASSSSTTSSSRSSTSATATPTTSASPATGSSTHGSNHDRNLAIILGCVLGALALGCLTLLLLLLCRRRRRRPSESKKYGAVNSSSENFIDTEKRHHRHRENQLSSRDQPNTFHVIHHQPKSRLESIDHQSVIPAAHSMNDDPYVPDVLDHPENTRGSHHTHDRPLYTSSEPTEHNHFGKPVLTAGIVGTAAGVAAKKHHRNSRGSRNDVDDEYPDSYVRQQRPRSSLRNSIESTERRRRSASLGREEIPPSPHHVHDPMPSPMTGLVTGTIAGATSSRKENRKTYPQQHDLRSQPMAYVSPERYERPVLPPFELSHSSDDADIERLRRTGTLDQRQALISQKNPIRHELSTVNSRSAVPTLASLSQIHGNTTPSINQSSSIQSSSSGISAIQPTPTQSFQLPRKPVNAHNSDFDHTSGLPNTAHQPYVDLRSNPWAAGSKVEADSVNANTHTKSFNQPTMLHNQHVPEAARSSSLPRNNYSSGQAPMMLAMPSAMNYSDEPSRSIASEQVQAISHHDQIQYPVYPHATEQHATYPSSIDHLHQTSLYEQPSQPTVSRPVTQSNISQPLHPLRQHQTYVPSSGPGFTTGHATGPYIQPTTAFDKHHDDSEPPLGRWNSRGRWKSYEDVSWQEHHDPGYGVGQAM